jgi:lipid-binding SYLF domain-containing protein
MLWKECGKAKKYYNSGGVQSQHSESYNRRMRKFISLPHGWSVPVVLLVLVAIAIPAHAQKREQKRLESAGQVLTEILNVPDNIPQKLLDKAECVIIVPSVYKVAIGIGGSFGRGAMTCRSGEDFTGAWGAPAMYALEGANIGIQLGGQATDFVFLIMNKKGAEALVKSKTKLGADASAAAGPKGRAATAATDALMSAEILSYSRAKGLFAGISLEGSTLRPDGSANHNIYGRKLSARDIVFEHKVGTPAAGSKLISTLNQHSPRNESDPKSLK